MILVNESIGFITMYTHRTNQFVYDSHSFVPSNEETFLNPDTPVCENIVQ
jgi:hypothetical protein